MPQKQLQNNRYMYMYIVTVGFVIIIISAKISGCDLFAWVVQIEALLAIYGIGTPYRSIMAL